VEDKKKKWGRKMSNRTGRPGLRTCSCGEKNSPFGGTGRPLGFRRESGKRGRVTGNQC